MVRRYALPCYAREKNKPRRSSQKFAPDGIDALLSAYLLVKNCANHHLSIGGILLTMADCTNISKAVDEAFQERFPREYFHTKISRSVKATNSTYAQASLIASRNTKLGAQYTEPVLSWQTWKEEKKHETVRRL